jgi:quercetin dioxygenase-like cupin family protein
MSSRKHFIQQSSFGLCSLFLPQMTFPQLAQKEFKGIVSDDDDGEIYQYPDRITGAATRTLKIKVSKMQGDVSMSFLSERFMPGDAIRVHKHTNEDELIFIHAGSGIFTLDEKEYVVHAGSVALVPRGVWHGLKNTGPEYIEMRFAYTPAGLENYFREIGTPLGQPFKKITSEQRAAIGIKYGLIRKT